jgi:hypothetical protein
MKTLITTLTFATLILAPAFIQSASAAPQGSYRTIYEGTYGGYPLERVVPARRLLSRNDLRPGT